MTLRAKALWAQAPMFVALVLAALFGRLALTAVGERSAVILEDNYRSVLACQRMKEAAERLDSAALFVVAGRVSRGAEQIGRYVPAFDAALETAAGNLTEPGEGEAVAHLRRDWIGFRKALDALLRASDPGTRERLYFDDVASRFDAVKAQAEAILGMNQDAMMRRSDEARRQAALANAWLVGAVLAGGLLALLLSTVMTARLLRPLSVLGLAVRRVGEGDLAVRAQVDGTDEVALLAREFNAMADHVERYRRSTLGELLEAQQAAQAAIDSLGDPVVVLAPGGQVLHVNRAAKALLGLRLEAPDPLAAVGEGVRGALAMARDHVLGGHGSLSPKGLGGAFRTTTAEGERSFLTRASPVYSEAGALVAATIVLQDVSRLRRMDELKDDLVATVAHEFRSALTSLRMSIHLCIERVAGPLSEAQADLLYAAREDCERLQTLVDEILDLSRIQDGRVELRRVRAEAEALIRATVAHHEDEADARSVRLRADVPPGLGVVEVDADRIALTFDNILLNALRYAPTGSEVVVSGRVEGAGLRFEIRDAGPGVPAELQTEMFERRVQGPGSTGAAGLGLFIAREAVQAHGGQIGVTSAPGEGTTVWFTLPRA